MHVLFKYIHVYSQVDQTSVIIILRHYTMHNYYIFIRVYIYDRIHTCWFMYDRSVYIYIRIPIVRVLCMQFHDLEMSSFILPGNSMVSRLLYLLILSVYLLVVLIVPAGVRACVERDIWIYMEVETYYDKFLHM